MNRRFQFFVVGSSTLLVALLLFGAAYSSSATPDEPYKQLGVYSEVISRIKSEYVEEPDLKAVTLGAINGLLESIDPYASYLNADQYKQYLKSKEGSKADVGLVVSKRFGHIGVVSAIPASAAAKAGLTTGDVIETINGVSTRDMPLAFAELLFRGETGSSVELGVLRVRRPEPQKITLIRQPVVFPAVTAKIVADQVGLIQVQSLAANRVKDVAAKIAELERQGAKKLILDLRQCATGEPEEGVKLANLFIDKGQIGYIQGQKVSKQNLEAIGAQGLTRLPLAVIVNRGTAAAAEVVAAALLDNKRADLIGERTYGDAAVRKAITMDDGAAVILSVAKYYSPSGKAIQDNGVTPPIAVAEFAALPDTEEENQADRPETDSKPGEDLPLKKAIEVVSKKS
jgi:carboxyl-terminal processing protease